MQHTIPTRTLIKSTILAVILAGVSAVCFILPAEYQIDPTGIGQALGLTKLSESAKEISIAKNDNLAERSDQIAVTVPPHRGIEYKFQMTQFEKMTYDWATDGAPLYFDLHGEPEGDTTGYFESYTIATSNEVKGSFTAPFTGSHGWYWKNKSDEPVEVYLNVSGTYQVIGLKQ